MDRLIAKHKIELDAFAKQKAENRRLWNIDEKSARLLYFFIRSKAPKRALEIGTSNGYSSFWLSLGIENLPSELHTIEAFEERFKMAKQNLERRTNIIQHFGKAEHVIPTLTGKFDFVFIDAGKIGYIDYIKLLREKLAEGALVIADNVISHTSTVQEYLDYVNCEPCFTTFRLDVGAGLEISIFTETESELHK